MTDPSATLGVVFENVEKRFGSLIALRRVSLQLAPGEFAVIVGHNGSGKTTLLRMGASLIRPTHGRVTYSGAESSREREVKQKIGMVGHNTLLYDELTAAENLEFFAKLYGLTQPAQISAQWLASAGLAERASDLVRTFSRGMRQRLAIARALLANPTLLFLDEPATGLDREGVAWLAQTLNEIRERECTVIMTSHGHSEAVDFATRAIAMRGGAVIADSGPGGDVRAILEREIVSSGKQSIAAGTR
jgi:heme ABC exporter ATP-binding subunit CcmA